MAERTRDTSGRYTGDVSNTDVVAAVRAHDPAATSEVGDELGISRQAADRRLRRLRDDGRVSSKKIGASLVWFLPRETGARATHAAETSDDADTPTDTHAAETPAHAAERETRDDTVPALPDGVPTGVDDDAARDAIAAVRAFLRTDGPASMREIVTAVMPTHTLGYDVPELEAGDRYRGAWWRKVVQPGLKTLDDVEYRENYQDYAHVASDDT